MRKLILALFIILGCASLANSGGIISFPGGGAVSSCPPFYNDTNVVLSWDGEHDDGVLNACDAAGDAVLFTDSSSDIAVYDIGGDSTTAKMKMDNTNEKMTYTQTGDQYAKTGTAQTICIDIYELQEPAADVPIFKAYQATDEANNKMWVYIDSNDPYRIAGGFYGGGSYNTAFSATFTYASWEIIGYAYDGVNRDDSANCGDQATWQDGWEEDLDEIDDDGTPWDTIEVGSQSVDPTVADAIYIRKWAIVDEYEFDCKTLTGW